MDSIRKNYNKCNEKAFSAFIDNINHKSNYKFRAHNPADGTILQDRYTFTKNKCRISIVYETKSQTLIVTAPQIVMEEIASFLPEEIFNDSERSISSSNDKAKEQLSQKQNSPVAAAQTKFQEKKNKEQVAKPQQGNNKEQVAKLQQGSNKEQVAKPQQVSNKEQVAKPQQGSNKEQVAKPQQSNSKEQVAKLQQSNSKDKAAKAQSIKSKEAKIKANTDKPKSKSQQKNVVENENIFIVKKITAEKFDELLKKLKANKGIRYKQTAADAQRAYIVSSSKEKALLKYKDGNIELNGIRGDLYGEIQLYMSQLSDYKTAIKTHIKYSGEEKRAQDIERQLKKKLPDAFEFLSEQSKLDLTIGIIDINNSAVVLSDYSTLLIPCFRGLERLIFDLQHAQGIVVKMIGQAYEKEDGKYVLKVGYRKKIPSVIYSEVMASLYTEYFLQRNFYAHSDGGYDNISRIISDKKQVQNIFNHILEVINYNGKKLKEIGFRIK